MFNKKYELLIGNGLNEESESTEMNNIKEISNKMTLKIRQNTNGKNTNLANEENCLALHFSDTKLPRTALASFPGSGNTWTRHLLQQATGFVYRYPLISDIWLKDALSYLKHVGVEFICKNGDIRIFPK